jgi:hypothetical protein
MRWYWGVWRDCSKLLLSCVALHAVAAPAAAHDKDLRTQSESWGDTEVSFCARPSPDAFGFPGHAFVGFSETPRGQPRVYRAIGHTVPAGAGIAPVVFTYFGGAPVAGRQAEERFTHMKQACLTVAVDRAVYQRALAAARPTLTIIGIPDNVAASLERYSLNENDCLDFTVRVALQIRTAGLSIPARSSTDTPAAYITKLINANP